MNKYKISSSSSSYCYYYILGDFPLSVNNDLARSNALTLIIDALLSLLVFCPSVLDKPSRFLKLVLDDSKVPFIL